MLSGAKHLLYRARDPSVAANAASHRPQSVSLREDDMTEDFKQTLCGERYSLTLTCGFYIMSHQNHR
jgi:hypothetical protein